MSYLLNHHGSFWFQIRVPKALQSRYGTYIRQNLYLTDRNLAQPLAYQLASQWLTRFAFEQNSGVQEGGSAALIALDQGLPVDSPDTFWDTRQIPQSNLADTIGSIDDLYQYWLKLSPHRSESTYREVKSIAHEFKKFTKNKTPGELVRVDITRFRDKLLADGLARATVAKRVSLISALLQTAFDGGLLPSNVARGLRIPKAKVELQRRRAFTTDELTRIFTSPVYSQRKRYNAGGGEAVVWVPMIALVTGARLEEICQLRVVDIIQDIEHGPLMRITDEGEQQRVKTMGSRRQVPLHPDLIRAGFLEYVEEVAEQSHEWLFPGLDPDHDGRRGGNFGKWFARYLRSTKGCNIQDQRVVFHSFRHTFKAFCRECEIAEEVHDALSGHSSASVSRNYGHVPTKSLVKAISQLELPVKLPRIIVGEV